MSNIVELGCPGHFICADRCRFRRHTQVGKYRVSTVGDFFPKHAGPRDRIGAGENDWFETMVFLTTGMPEKGNDGCGCCEVVDYSELECIRAATAGEAQRNHEAMIQMYKEKA